MIGDNLVVSGFASPYHTYIVARERGSYCDHSILVYLVQL
jgi:hypothetical protein